MAANATVVLSNTMTGTGHANLTSAVVATLKTATGTSDVFNVIVDVEDATVDVGTLTVDDVETINVTAQGVMTDADEDGNDDTADVGTLALSADAVTSIVVDGYADLSLDTTSTTLTSVNASTMTGALTYTADGATAGTTVTGGSGDDALTASGSQDVLIGGAGDDTLTGASLTTLTGGEGSDTFIMVAPTNVNSYSTITDLSSGDIIDLTDASVFASSAIVLGDTAVFQDYANATVKEIDDNSYDAAWFQYNGNTYIIESGNDGADDFVAGADMIIKISGLVDPSTASYNQTNGTLEIA